MGTRFVDISVEDAIFSEQREALDQAIDVTLDGFQDVLDRINDLLDTVERSPRAMALLTTTRQACHQIHVQFQAQVEPIGRQLMEALCLPQASSIEETPSDYPPGEPQIGRSSQPLFASRDFSTGELWANGSYRSGEVALPPLTVREQQIISLLLDGSTDQQIMEALHLKKGTVRWHLRSIFLKLRVQNRREATTCWQRHYISLGTIQAEGTTFPDMQRPPRLSRQEGRILELAQVGKSSREIAQCLHIQIGTVRNHCTTIYRKLGVHRLSEAVALWERLQQKTARASTST